MHKVRTMRLILILVSVSSLMYGAQAPQKSCCSWMTQCLAYCATVRNYATTDTAAQARLGNVATFDSEEMKNNYSVYTGSKALGLQTAARQVRNCPGCIRCISFVCCCQCFPCCRSKHTKRITPAMPMITANRPGSPGSQGENRPHHRGARGKDNNPLRRATQVYGEAVANAAINKPGMTEATSSPHVHSLSGLPAQGTPPLVIGVPAVVSPTTFLRAQKSNPPLPPTASRQNSFDKISTLNIDADNGTVQTTSPETSPETTPGKAHDAITATGSMVSNLPSPSMIKQATVHIATR